MLFCSFIVYEIGDDYLLFLLVNPAILRSSLGGEFDFVFIAGM
jgi:hypothetical protein